MLEISVLYLMTKSMLAKEKAKAFLEMLRHFLTKYDFNASIFKS